MHLSAQKSEHVPTAAKHLKAVRLDDYYRRSVKAVLIIAHLQLHALPHAFHYDVKQIVGGRILKQHALMQRLALMNPVAYGESRKHPRLDGVILQHMPITYIIGVSPGAVALYVHPEHVGDSIPVAVERGACHFHAAAHLRLHPLLVDVLKRHLSILLDGIYKPDVRPE